MMSGNLADRFSLYAHDLQYFDLPAEMAHEAKRRALDTPGCALRAFHSEPAMMARQLATKQTGTFAAAALFEIE